MKSNKNNDVGLNTSNISSHSSDQSRPLNYSFELVHGLLTRTILDQYSASALGALPEIVFSPKICYLETFTGKSIVANSILATTPDPKPSLSLTHLLFMLDF